MAHPSTISAYAIACHEEQSLQRQLEGIRAEKSRLHSQVTAHLQNTGPVTCDLNNTDEKVTLRLKRESRPLGQGQHALGQFVSPKSVIEAIVSRPNQSSVA